VLSATVPSSPGSEVILSSFSLGADSFPPLAVSATLVRSSVPPRTSSSGAYG